MYLQQSISSDSSEQSALPSHSKLYSIQSPLTHKKSVTAGHDPGYTAPEIQGHLFSLTDLKQHNKKKNTWST